MARLIISSPDGKRGVFEIGKPVITIGRGSANDLVLNDPSVSRFHAVLKKSASDEVSIADRGSTNGVLVEGLRIANETPIASGAKVKIGIYDLKLEAMREASRDAALVVQKAEIPSALRDVLAGKAMPQQTRASIVAGDASAMREQVSRLSKENFLLRMLFDAGKVLSGHRTVPALV